MASKPTKTTTNPTTCQIRAQLVAVFIAFWIYLVIGAAMFTAIERGHADDLQHDFMIAATNFVRNNSCVHRGEILAYSNALVNAYSGGLRWTVEEGFNHTSKYGYQHWDLIDSLFFCATVVTTIGYGRLAPSTQLGQSVCIIYALIGIPLSGLLVTIIGQQLQNRLKNIWRNLLARLRCLTSAKSSIGRRFASITAITFAGVGFYIVLIIIPACLFYFLEGWDWLTSQYYAFISFTTIGFGDYVAGDSHMLSVTGRVAYKVVLICYLVFGMGFVTMLLQGMQKKNAERVKRLGKRKVITRILRKRRAPNTNHKATPHKKPPESEEFIVITTDVVDGDSEGEMFEMQDLESGMEFDTISVVDNAIQTVHSPGCDAGTQTYIMTSMSGYHDKPTMHDGSTMTSSATLINGPDSWQITENIICSDDNE